MDILTINPYVRFASYSSLCGPYLINDRINFDYELIYVADGVCTITIGGKPHNYSKGDILLIPPGITHRFEVPKHSIFSQPHIHFDMMYDVYSKKRYISFKNIGDIPKHEQVMISENIFKNPLPSVLKVKNRDSFFKSFFGIIDNYNSHFGQHDLVLKGEMSKLLSIVLEDVFSSDDAKTSRLDPLIEQVKNYLVSNISNHISLDDLSMQFYINKFTLDRQFKRVYGLSVIKYVNKLRLDTAIRLLETGMSVTEVSNQLGFINIYTFSRFFKNSMSFSSSHLYPSC